MRAGAAPGAPSQGDPSLPGHVTRTPRVKISEARAPFPRAEPLFPGEALRLRGGHSVSPQPAPASGPHHPNSLSAPRIPPPQTRPCSDVTVSSGNLGARSPHRKSPAERQQDPPRSSAGRRADAPGAGQTPREPGRAGPCGAQQPPRTPRGSGRCLRRAAVRPPERGQGCGPSWLRGGGWDTEPACLGSPSLPSTPCRPFPGTAPFGRWGAVSPRPGRSHPTGF